jgi:plasmid stabilization system protein ParE
MDRIRISADAVRDLERIVEFISGDSRDAARRWASDIVELFHLFAMHPRMGERHRWGRRFCRRFSKGNYVI